MSWSAGSSPRVFDIATFTLGSDSFGFLGGNWFDLNATFNNIRRPWTGGYITELDGLYYTAFSDRIGRLEDTNFNYGERIERIIDMAFEQDERFTIQKAELGISQGENPAVGSVAPVDEPGQCAVWPRVVPEFR